MAERREMTILEKLLQQIQLPADDPLGIDDIYRDYLLEIGRREEDFSPAQSTFFLDILKHKFKHEPQETWDELIRTTHLVVEEPQAVANIPISNKFQPLAESMELSSDAQFPTAGTATPDAPFPE
ncbi:hypothetical protein JTE90_024680, partial [Oedothorax gibbosus]